MGECVARLEVLEVEAERISGCPDNIRALLGLGARDAGRDLAGEGREKISSGSSSGTGARTGLPVGWCTAGAAGDEGCEACCGSEGEAGRRMLPLPCGVDIPPATEGSPITGIGRSTLLSWCCSTAGECDWCAGTAVEAACCFKGVFAALPEADTWLTILPADRPEAGLSILVTCAGYACLPKLSPTVEASLRT